MKEIRDVTSVLQCTPKARAIQKPVGSTKVNWSILIMPSRMNIERIWLHSIYKNSHSSKLLASLFKDRPWIQWRLNQAQYLQPWCTKLIPKNIRYFAANKISTGAVEIRYENGITISSLDYDFIFRACESNNIASFADINTINTTFFIIFGWLLLPYRKPK